MAGVMSRHTATPDVARELDRIWYETDVRGVLPAVRAPALLVARARYPRKVEVAKHVASLMADATVASVPGNFGAEVTLLMCHAGPTGPNTPGVVDADSTSSPHRTGVPFLFGDGSVHFIGNRINIATWMALATRAGNESIIGDY